MLGRCAYLLAAAVLSAAAGLGVAQLAAAPVAPSTAPARFAVSAEPYRGELPDWMGEGANGSYVSCPWQPGGTSITLGAAEHLDCDSYNRETLPVPRPGSFELLDSPLGGRLYPAQNGSLSDDLRLVRRPATGGVLLVGPPLLEFGDYSGGVRPVVVDDGDTVWIFDCRTERGSEVLRVSTTTGQVLQRTVMPDISRPDVALDRYGFWMAQAPNSFSGPRTRLGVWLAPLGATHGELVKATTDFVAEIRPAGADVDVVAWRVPSASIVRWRFSPIG